MRYSHQAVFARLDVLCRDSGYILVLDTHTTDESAKCTRTESGSDTEGSCTSSGGSAKGSCAGGCSSTSGSGTCHTEKFPPN